MKQICVIGGGVAGLASALSLQRKCPRAQITVIEATSELGGKVQTAERDGFILEKAAYCLETASMIPLSRWLRREMDLEDQVLPAQGAPRFVRVSGELHHFPESPPFPLPLDEVGVQAASIFSDSAKQMILNEDKVPRSEADDETLASFFRRRLGDEYYQLIASPMFSSIFMTSLDNLSLKTVMPKLQLIEQKIGSLTKAKAAFLKLAKVIPSPALAQLSVLKGLKAWMKRDPLGAHGKPFFTLRYGMGELVASMAALFSGDVRLSQPVERIVRTDHGLLVSTPNEHLACDVVVCAAPAWAAATMLKEEFPDLAKLLAEIRHTSCAVAYFAVSADALSDFPGADVFIPHPEGLHTRSVNIVSHKYPAWVPEGMMLVRAMLGGDHADILEKTDAELMATVQAELAEIFGCQLMPRFSQLFRLDHACPIYGLGHGERVERIRGQATSEILFRGEAYCAGGIPGVISECQDWPELTQ